MSDINTIWNSVKDDLSKSANKGLITLGSKLLPAADEAVAATKAIATPKSGLSQVAHNIDDAAPAMRKVKGTAKTVGEGPKLLSAPSTQLSGSGASTGIKSLGDHWRGLSQGTRSGIKATGLLGAGGVAGHLDGRRVGKEIGMETGSAKGYDAGVADAAASAQQSSMDPGILGRLMEVFTGRQPATVNPADPEMAMRRQAALKRILAGS